VVADVPKKGEAQAIEEEEAMRDHEKKKNRSIHGF